MVPSVHQTFIDGSVFYESHAKRGIHKKQTKQTLIDIAPCRVCSVGYFIALRTDPLNQRTE